MFLFWSLVYSLDGPNTFYICLFFEFLEENFSFAIHMLVIYENLFVQSYLFLESEYIIDHICFFLGFSLFIFWDYIVYVYCLYFRTQLVLGIAYIFAQLVLEYAYIFAQLVLWIAYIFAQIVLGITYIFAQLVLGIAYIFAQLVLGVDELLEFYYLCA